jgi:uncharacterized protein
VNRRIDIRFLDHPLFDAAGTRTVRAVHFTDLHFKRRPGFRERVLEQIEEIFCPDLILYTGDTIGMPHRWQDALAWASSLSFTAPAFAVPGNWDDRWTGGREGFQRFCQSAGMTPLINRNERLVLNGRAFRLVGLDDWREGTPDPEAAFDGVREAEETIVLVHNPDGVSSILDRPWKLALCGHTHGGQVRIPGVGPLATSTRAGRDLADGMCRAPDGRDVLVNRGLGVGWKVPFRLFCPPEIWILDL